MRKQFNDPIKLPLGEANSDKVACGFPAMLLYIINANARLPHHSVCDLCAVSVYDDAVIAAEIVLIQLILSHFCH